MVFLVKLLSIYGIATCVCTCSCDESRRNFTLLLLIVIRAADKLRQNNANHVWMLMAKNSVKVSPNRRQQTIQSTTMQFICSSHHTRPTPAYYPSRGINNQNKSQEHCEFYYIRTWSTFDCLTRYTQHLLRAFILLECWCTYRIYARPLLSNSMYVWINEYSSQSAWHNDTAFGYTMLAHYIHI